MYQSDIRRRQRLKDLGWGPSQYDPRPLVYEAYTDDNQPPGVVIFHPNSHKECVQSTVWHHLNDIR